MLAKTNKCINFQIKVSGLNSKTYLFTFAKHCVRNKLAGKQLINNP